MTTATSSPRTTWDFGSRSHPGAESSGGRASISALFLIGWYKTELEIGTPYHRVPPLGVRLLVPRERKLKFRIRYRNPHHNPVRFSESSIAIEVHVAENVPPIGHGLRL